MTTEDKFQPTARTKFKGGAAEEVRQLRSK
jgi:hypothetical protein